MELQLILINNQALCLHRNAPNGPVTTLKLRGEPINTVEFPSEYLKRVCSQLGGVSLSQLTVSLTHDQVNDQTLRNWGMALVCAERLNIGRLRARLPRPISPHEQLELTEEGISCLSGSSRQALMSFDALGTTMSPSAPLALPSQVEAPVVSRPHPEVLERLEALEEKVVDLEEDTRSLQQALDVKKEVGEVHRLIVNCANIIAENSSRGYIVIGNNTSGSYGVNAQKLLNQGDKVNRGDKLLSLYNTYNASIFSYVVSPINNGYVYYLSDQDIRIGPSVISGSDLLRVLAVISSDPNDTLPQIKAWLAMNDIPFYQGGMSSNTNVTLNLLNPFSPP